MAILQSINVLSAPGNYPGNVPTAASPSPVFGLSSSRVQGVSVYSNSANPTGQSAINIDYFVGNQKFSGTLIASQTAAAVIAAS